MFLSHFSFFPFLSLSLPPSPPLSKTNIFKEKEAFFQPYFPVEGTLLQSQISAIHLVREPYGEL